MLCLKGRSTLMRQCTDWSRC